MLEQLLQHPLTGQLGTVLLHSLWQGFALWLLLILALRLIPSRSHTARHTIATAVLLIWLAAPALTLVSLSPPASQTQNAPAPGRTEQAAPFPAEAAQATPQLPAGTGEVAAAPAIEPGSPQPGGNSVVPLLALIWMSVAGLLSIRYLGGLISVNSLKRTARPAHEHMERFRRLAEQFGINRPVALLRSRHLDTPAAFGLLRPVVLLPLSAASGLTTRQLELLVAHELAHIRRHDYLVSIIQGLAEALLFYHPLTWTLSRVLLREREHACDELALQITGAQPIELVRTLAQLEGARLNGPALAATGNLKARVQQLLETPGRQSPAGGVPVLIILALIAAGLLSLAPLNAQANEQPQAVVVIDPGHSDTFPGAAAHGLDEAELNLLIARKVAEQLREADVRVLLTRDGNAALGETLAVDLAARAGAAAGADLLISLHAGAASSESTSGVRSYVTTGEHSESSRQLAAAVLQQLSRATGARTAGPIDQPTNRLLNLAGLPAIMLEYGYLSNAQEAGLLRSTTYQDQVAAGIAAGILNYLDANELLTRSPALVVAADWLDVPEGGWPTYSSLAQLERAAGAFVAPTQLPDGYYLSNAVITPGTGALHLTWTTRLRTDIAGAPERLIGLSQVHQSDFTPVNVSLGAPVKTVNVDGQQALFVPGSWLNVDGNQSWSDEGGSLIWRQAELVLQLGMNSGNSADVLNSLLEAAGSLALIDSAVSELPVPTELSEPPSYRWVTLIGPASFGGTGGSPVSLAAGSRLVLEERTPEHHRRLVMTGAEDGSLQSVYQENGSEQPVGAVTEAWAQTLLTEPVVAALKEAVEQDGLQSSRRTFGRPGDQTAVDFVRSLPSGWPFTHLAPADGIGSARVHAWTLDGLVQARAHGIIGDGLYEYLLWEYRQYGPRQQSGAELLNYALALVSGEEARLELVAAYADW